MLKELKEKRNILACHMADMTGLSQNTIRKYDDGEKVRDENKKRIETIDDYETRGLTYYADGKLVFDEETMPVNDDDIPNIIGTEALNHFGEFMPSTIHVRNNNYHKDYEIIQVRQNWGDLYPEKEEE